MSPLDVLICTHERPDHVVDAVRDALAQLGPADRVVVLDQSRRVGPTARALEALGDPRLEVRAAPPRGLPAARNRALALARAPLVVFLDDDVRLEPGCLDAHRVALEEPGVAGTVGAIEERGMAWNARRTACRVGLDGRVRVRLEGGAARDVGSVKGCNMGFRRAAVEAVGGFDEGYRGTAFLEETDLSTRLRRAGHRLRYIPAARLIHLAAPAGGVRVEGPQATARWRFHNTARYLRRHRGLPGLALGAVTFAGIAAHRGIIWRDPAAPVHLLAAFAEGALHARR
jgi:GT2 family glycosyltransferase